MSRVVTVHLDDIEIPARFLQDGTLSSNDVIKARQVSTSTGRPVRVILDRLGIVSQETWAKSVADDNGLRLTNLDKMPLHLPRDERLSMDYMKRNSVALLSLDDPERPTIAVANPSAQQVRQALGMIFGDRIDYVVATDRDIEAALIRSEAASENGPDQTGGIILSNNEDEINRLTELANQTSTMTYVDDLISYGVEDGATDIHIEMHEDGPRVRLRIDGMLIAAAAFERFLYDGVIARIKILADLDIGETRMPQEGRIRHELNGRFVDVRVASVPAVHGDTVVLHLLSKAQHFARVDSLAMPDLARHQLNTALAQPNGLILIAGPTDSGKTTTLHAALSELNETGRKIITIEEPVEIEAAGLVQIEIKPELGWTFASALRSVLRHDPDVIMVGEIRDAETADLAVRAAMTGKLVLTTMQTNRAAEAVVRLSDMGVPDYLLKSTLQLAGAQRLVRTLCDHCSEPIDLSENEDFHSLVQTFVEADPTLGNPDKWVPHVAVGCPYCANTGYAGRMAVFEMLDRDMAIAAAAGGTARFRTMGQEGLGLFTRGQTTLEELVRVFGAGEFWT